MNHTRLAKKRARALWYARGAKQRQRLYRDLIGTTRSTLEAVARVREQLLSPGVTGVELPDWLGAQYETRAVTKLVHVIRAFDGGDIIDGGVLLRRRSVTV